MTDAQRESLRVLGEVWSLAPDIRLGQLMAHLGFLGEVHLDRGLGDIDDDELLAVLYRHRAELLARLQVAPIESTPRVPSAISISGSPISPQPLSEQN